MNITKKIINKFWFTLVELVVVMTILAILWTVWFIVFTWHLSWVRDANRTSQIISMYDWLEAFRISNTLPEPENSVEVKLNWTLIWYQWYIWKTILSNIKYSKAWLDPKDNTYFTYYLNADKKSFQLMAYLEDKENVQVVLNKQDNWGLLVPSTNAAYIDYSKRFPTFYWSKLWIITEDVTNLPIQDITSINSVWYIDITPSISSTYKVNFTDQDSFTASWYQFYMSNLIYSSTLKFRIS